MASSSNVNLDDEGLDAKQRKILEKWYKQREKLPAQPWSQVKSMLHDIIGQLLPGRGALDTKKIIPTPEGLNHPGWERVATHLREATIPRVVFVDSEFGQSLGTCKHERKVRPGGSCPPCWQFPAEIRWRAAMSRLNSMAPWRHAEKWRVEGRLGFTKCPSFARCLQLSNCDGWCALIDIVDLGGVPPPIIQLLSDNEVDKICFGLTSDLPVIRATVRGLPVGIRSWYDARFEYQSDGEGVFRRIGCTSWAPGGQPPHFIHVFDDYVDGVEEPLAKHLAVGRTSERGGLLGQVLTYTGVKLPKNKYLTGWGLVWFDRKAPLEDKYQDYALSDAVGLVVQYLCSLLICKEWRELPATAVSRRCADWAECILINYQVPPSLPRRFSLENTDSSTSAKPTEEQEEEEEVDEDVARSSRLSSRAASRAASAAEVEAESDGDRVSMDYSDEDLDPRAKTQDDDEPQKKGKAGRSADTSSSSEEDDDDDSGNAPGEQDQDYFAQYKAAYNAKAKTVDDAHTAKRRKLDQGEGLFLHKTADALAKAAAEKWEKEKEAKAQEMKLPKSRTKSRSGMEQARLDAQPHRLPNWGSPAPWESEEALTDEQRYSQAYELFRTMRGHIKGIVDSWKRNPHMIGERARRSVQPLIGQWETDCHVELAKQNWDYDHSEYFRQCVRGYADSLRSYRFTQQDYDERHQYEAVRKRIQKMNKWQQRNAPRSDHFKDIYWDKEARRWRRYPPQHHQQPHQQQLRHGGYQRPPPHHGQGQHRHQPHYSQGRSHPYWQQQQPQQPHWRPDQRYQQQGPRRSYYQDDLPGPPYSQGDHDDRPGPSRR